MLVRNWLSIRLTFDSNNQTHMWPIMVNGHIILPHILQNSFPVNTEVGVKKFPEKEIISFILVNILLYHYSTPLPIIVQYLPETDALTAVDETCMMLMLIMILMLILILTLKSMSMLIWRWRLILLLMSMLRVMLMLFLMISLMVVFLGESVVPLAFFSFNPLIFWCFLHFSIGEVFIPQKVRGNRIIHFSYWRKKSQVHGHESMTSLNANIPGAVSPADPTTMAWRNSNSNCPCW